MADPQCIAIAGDWHGNIPWGQHAMTAAKDHGAEIIVHLGDFGYWTDNPETRKMLSRWEHRLAWHKLHLWWLDGNHENHWRLNAQPINPETGMRDITEHIHHLPRGHRWVWNDRTWMALGGAHSVDWQGRTEGKDWWPEEFLTWAQLEAAIDPGPVDIMLTHDMPRGARCPELDRKTWGFPDSELAASAQHRELIRTVVEEVRPEVLYHGHMHCRYDDLLEHRGGKTLIRGLDCDGQHLGYNMIYVAGNGVTITEG